MSVTKLKTVGHWQSVHGLNNAVAGPGTTPAGSPANEPRAHVRGRVITGMLTGGDAFTDARSIAPDHREEGRR
jgi:hypothetical protein